MEKVLAKVIYTGGEIVCTHGMHFYHRSMCKPIYITFQGMFHKKTEKGKKEEMIRDFTVPLKTSLTK